MNIYGIIPHPRPAFVFEFFQNLELSYYWRKLAFQFQLVYALSLQRAAPSGLLNPDAVALTAARSGELSYLYLIKRSLLKQKQTTPSRGLLNANVEKKKIYQLLTTHVPVLQSYIG